MSSSAEPDGSTALPLHRTGPGDRYFDYCLEPYRPRRPPAGKLRGENLLWKALELAGCVDRARPVIEALRASLGRDMTVWGVKHDGERLFFELYVYDPRREEPRASLAGLRATLAPFLAIAPEVGASVPAMMISLDLDADLLARRSIDVVHLYLTGTTLHEGRSYRVDARGAELENVYRFLEPKRDVETLLPLLRSSVFVDYGEPRTLARVIVPELFACKRVCVAKKRTCDAIYFSGIAIDQLLFFLRRHRYPASLIDFAAAHADELDHLYFDCGLDLAMHDGALVHPKTGFYGTF